MIILINSSHFTIMIIEMSQFTFNNFHDICWIIRSLGIWLII